MNWSSSWPSDPVEADKVADDAARFGTGFHKDGKHIPADEIYLAPGETILIFLDGNKRRSIDVIIVGDLALDYDNDGWNIYHVPTLAWFNKAVPATPCSRYSSLCGDNCEKCICSDNYLYERDQLLNWMKKVQENYPTSWQMLRLLTPENYADKGIRAKEIIQEWCLSVKVE